MERDSKAGSMLPLTELVLLNDDDEEFIGGK
jgi:hypothetical protein